MTSPGRVGSLPGCRASGAIAAEKCPLSQTFPALYDSARRRLEKLSSLEERKAAPESVFTPVSCSKCLRLRRQTSRPAPMASVPESGPCVSLHFLSLENTFLGQNSPAHGEGGCGSVSEGPRSHAGFTWLMATDTPHGDLERCGRLPPGCCNAEAGSKASCVRRKKTATGGICNHCWATQL